VLFEKLEEIPANVTLKIHSQSDMFTLQTNLANNKTCTVITRVGAYEFDFGKSLNLVFF